MCGILGASTSRNVDDIKIRWLFAENERRGKDSSGMFTFHRDKNNTTSLHKTIEKGSSFIKSKEFSTTIKGAAAVIGHTRGASVGYICQQNAHPFVVGEGESQVVGVHNGFVLPELMDAHLKEFGFDRPFDVDSQLIFEALSKNNGDYNILSKIEGAITVAWAMPNKWPSRVFLYRRQARELHFGYFPEGIYFSSEKEPLQLLGAKSVYELRDSHLIILNNGVIEDYVKLEPPKIKSLKLNCSRTYWESGVPLEEYDDIIPKNHTPTVTNYSSDYQLKVFKDNNPTYGANPQVYDWEKEMLIEDVVTELSYLQLVDISPSFKRTIESKGLQGSVILIKVVDDINRQPMPGWLVQQIDRCGASTNVSGTTSLSGVVALTIPENECGDDVSFIIGNIIMPLKTYTITVKAIKNRVMEVILAMPFQEKGEPHSSDEYKAIYDSIIADSDDQFSKFVLFASDELVQQLSFTGSEKNLRGKPNQHDWGNQKGNIPKGNGVFETKGGTQDIYGTPGSGNENIGELIIDKYKTIASIHRIVKSYTKQELSIPYIKTHISNLVPKYAKKLEPHFNVSLMVVAATHIYYANQKYWMSFESTTDGVRFFFKWILRNSPYSFLHKGKKLDTTIGTAILEFINDEPNLFKVYDLDTRWD